MKTRHAIGLAALTTLAVAGCGQNLQQNPTYQKQVKRTEDLEQDLKALSRRLSAFESEFQKTNQEFQTVSRDVSTLMSGGVPGGSPEAAAAIEQRLLKIEASLQETGDGLASVAKRIEQVESKPGAARTAATRTAEEPGAKPADSGAATAPAPTARPVRMTSQGETSQTRTARRQAPAEPAPAAGQYYMIQPGETRAQIAAKFKTTEARLRESNHVPAGKDAIPGQRIYVPGS